MPRTSVPSSTQIVSMIGYRGTGKSTIGRLLAQRLGFRCIDTDDEIESRAECSIAEIFADKGEETFRGLESQVIADMVKLKRVVLSLGGGAVLRQQNRRLIREAGPVIWLTASTQTIDRRINGDHASRSRRPNLTAQGGLAEIEAMLDHRRPLYEECASLSISTDQQAPHHIADQLAKRLSS